MSHTILIVEDNENIRRFIRTALELEGYTVLEATLIQDGAAIARRERPDLVVLDLALPDGSGWDFLQSMQSQPETRGLRVVILTASADHGMADRGLAAGAIAFVTKPVAAAQLVAAVRKAIETKPASA